MPVAFVLASPGANHRFDGLNATASAAAPAFALPGRSGSATDDDPMLAVGLGELSARLSCPRGWPPSMARRARPTRPMTSGST
jgi:hypothetical protein